MQVDLNNIRESVSKIDNDFNSKDAQVYSLLLKICEVCSVLGTIKEDPHLQPLKEEAEHLKNRISKSYSELLTTERKSGKTREENVQKKQPLLTQHHLNQGEENLLKLRTRLANVCRCPEFDQKPSQKKYLLQLVGQISLYIPLLNTPEKWIERLENLNFKSGDILKDFKEFKESFENEIESYK